MILPSKHLASERSLIGIGAHILPHANGAVTVSRLWHVLSTETPHLTFDWFVLALDFLFSIGAIEMHNGRIVRSTKE